MKTNNIPTSELISSYNYSKSFISDKLDEVISLERTLKSMVVFSKSAILDAYSVIFEYNTYLKNGFYSKEEIIGMSKYVDKLKKDLMEKQRNIEFGKSFVLKDLNAVVPKRELYLRVNEYEGTGSLRINLVIEYGDMKSFHELTIPFVDFDNKKLNACIKNEMEFEILVNNGLILYKNNDISANFYMTEIDIDKIKLFKEVIAK